MDYFNQIFIWQQKLINQHMSTHHSPQTKNHQSPSPKCNPQLSPIKQNISLPSINPQAFRKISGQQTLQKLVQMNREYLKDKVKIGDVRKPSKYAYRLPSKTGSSEYNRTYARSLPSNNMEQSNPNRSRIANNLKLPNEEITYQSTYSVKNGFIKLQFSRLKRQQLLKQAQRFKPQRYERKQGPFFTQTSYKRDFATHMKTKTCEQIQPGGHIALGGKFNDNTTYKQHFHTNEGSTPPMAIIKKDHSIFVKIGKSKQSNYQQSYLRSNDLQKKVQSCKPSSKLGLILSKMRYKTEYTDRYMEPQQSEKRQFEYMNNEQLKNYVLNILNN